MAFTSKINSIVKAVQSNLPAGIGSQISNFASSITGQVQNNKIAAKLLNKSPLELDSATPSSHMKENPFQYGTVQYPQEAGNMGDGHYVVFDVLTEQQSAFKYTKFDGTNIKKLSGKDLFSGDLGALDLANPTAEAVYDLKQSQASKRIRKPNSGFAKSFDRYTNISDTIMLYTPKSSLNFAYGVEYEGVGTGMIGMGIRSAIDTSGVADAMGKSGEFGAEAIKRLAGSIGDLITDGASTAVQQQVTGTAVNPMLEQTFKSVPFRKFQFDYQFIPKNVKEKDDVHKIINLFKFHMHPEFAQGSEARFIVPSRFQIMYMYRSKENTYVPRVSRCVLTNMDVNYAPGDDVQSFKGDNQGAPMSNITMNLQFSETEIMTKETIAQGY